MKRCLLPLLMLALAGAAPAMAKAPKAPKGKAATVVRTDVVTDTIPYTVNYHWGFINKEAGAGRVVMSVASNKVTGTDTLSATLVGASVPWFGRVYQIHDTLRAVMTRLNDVDPRIIHERVLHENGLYTKPRVLSTDSGGVQLAPIRASRDIYGQGTLDADSATMEAVRVTADMLGFFYYARAVDWSAMSPGDTLVMPIDWEAAPEGCSATITYRGPGQCTIKGTDYPSYQMTLTYTYEGKPSGYEIACQVDRQTRIPLIISATIEIGHVEMVYAPVPPSATAPSAAPAP